MLTNSTLYEYISLYLYDISIDLYNLPLYIYDVIPYLTLKLRIRDLVASGVAHSLLDLSHPRGPRDYNF
jgi:hypothetical protein